MANITVLGENQAKSFWEGDEYCRLYFKTDDFLFGTSTLLPGKKGGVDPGHTDAWEVFYVIEGIILCQIPGHGLSRKLKKGDTILIPPSWPHQLENVGQKRAFVVWSQAKSRKSE